MGFPVSIVVSDAFSLEKRNHMKAFGAMMTIVPSEGGRITPDLFVRMQQQSMPPAYERVQRPTFGQIDQVGQFIDELDPAASGSAPGPGQGGYTF